MSATDFDVYDSFMKDVRKKIADECRDAIEREVHELDMKEQGFYQTATHGEVIENIMKIIRGSE